METHQTWEPWNKGKLVGQKPPLKPKDIWAIRIHLQHENRVRDLAMFNLAIDSKLVGPEYSCSLRKIDMVKAVDGREFNNVAGFRRSYGTTIRRVSIQGLVCSPRMVVIQIRRHKSLEMPLVEHDDVVEKFSA